MPRTWKLELRANAPMRVIGWEGWSLLDELKYYEITQSEFARFLGIHRDKVNRWVKGRVGVPREVVMLMAVLSQFPPLFVRNRLTGKVKLIYWGRANQWVQKGFREGAE